MPGVYCRRFCVYISFSAAKKSSETFKPYYQTKVAITGVIVSDINQREKDVQFVLKPNGAKYEKILVTAGKFPKYNYGDEIKMTGKLGLAPVYDDFNYRDFLAVKGIYGVMFRPQIEVVEEGADKNFFEFSFSKSLLFKQKLRNVISSELSPPQSTLLAALLLGDQGQMPTELKQQLNITGLRHITAISGQHIVIITNMLMAFLLAVGLWKKQAVLISFLLMIFFILLTGAESSAVRSGIMGSMMFLGKLLGRMNVAFRSLVFAAATMLFFNPLLLLHDVGFELSFLAVLGIIVANSFFQNVFHFVPLA